TRERQKELLCDSSSSSSSILLSHLRFLPILCSIRLPLLCSSSGSPSIPSNLRFSFDGQKQAFVVVGRVSTGIEAKLKVLYGSGARKFREAVAALG
uniref:Uncharacterized protein n=1 Tax=Brassica oleracea var. oleracea TaxID=109376 RepID=A0A0D3AJK6_BRAOL